AIEDAAADDSGDVAAMLRRLVDAAAAAVVRTQDENPTNKAAGVVDAGAQGLYLLLEGALAAVEGRAGVAAPVAAPQPHRARVAAGAHAQAEGVASWKGAYDVQFLVEHPSRPIAIVRKEMEEFGADCVLVVGNEDVMKVHVHTLHPDQ